MTFVAPANELTSLNATAANEVLPEPPSLVISSFPFPREPPLLTVIEPETETVALAALTAIIGKAVTIIISDKTSANSFLAVLVLFFMLKKSSFFCPGALNGQTEHNFV